MRIFFLIAFDVIVYIEVIFYEQNKKPRIISQWTFCEYKRLSRAVKFNANWFYLNSVWFNDRAFY